MVTDSQEKSVDSYIKNLAILSEKSRTCNAVLVTKDFLGISVPEDLDVLCISHALLHCL